MPNIKQITLPSGTTYDIVDQGARDLIAELLNYTTYLGVTTTPLTDGATTNPIVINGENVTATNGDVATYNTDEYIFNGTVWQAFGSLSGLGSLAYKNSATGTFTPQGSVSTPTFSGSELTSTGSFTPSGSITISTGSGTANYTPAGTVSTPTITVTPTTGTVNSITDVGTLPAFTATVANENLTLGWDAGSLPTKGSDTSVMTGASATSSQPTFSGTGAELTGSFSGTSGSVSVTGTPSGTVSQPSFTGTAGTVTVS